MARIRTIKPEFPHSESMGRVSREARLCFILLWTIADDAGRLRGNSRMLASLLYPYDDDAKKYIDAWLDQLSVEGCIARYEVDGTNYVQVLNWLNHQKIDKPSASKLPPFAEPSRKLANPREHSATDQDQGRDLDQGKDQEVDRKSRSRATATSVAKPEGVDQQTWDDWIALRKSKRAPITATVVADAIKEAEKARMSLNDFLAKWCARGSQGLQADWLRPHERGISNTKPASKHAGFEKLDYQEGVNHDGSFV